MLAVSRRRRALDIWPGFVDALSALIMVLVFLLLLFVLGQFLLTDALSSRDQILRRLDTRIAELADVLAMERATKEDLQGRLTRLRSTLAGTEKARADLQQQLAQMTAQAQSNAAATAKTRAELEDAYGVISADKEKLEVQVARLATLEAKLKDLDEAQGALQAKRAQLETDLQGSRRETAEQAGLTQQAQAEVGRLNEQLGALREQIEKLNTALATSEGTGKEQALQIEDLGKRLNLALASKVEKLSRYQSEFFGKLREALKDDPNVRIVGDRFVLPSEVLFDSASAELDQQGKRQVKEVAGALKEISGKIPQDIDWVLRVDGHTDKRNVRSKFPSNWELSTARAISIVKYMISLGIPPDRLVAAGFGKYHPIDPGDSAEAYSRNRRIELKLTNR